jgi:glutathione S-transferase
MHQHTWLLGPQFSAVDPFAIMLCRWTRHFDPAISAPASVQRVLADEKLSAPWV